jgi:uncharacterized protein (TIGR03032 family)
MKFVIAKSVVLGSVYTTTFPQILTELNASIAVTTYQAGKLVLLRAKLGPDGPSLNTHFRGFNRPMGFAWEPGRFAIGCNTEVWQFHDVQVLAAKLDAPDSPNHHDAAFLPRIAHVTGQVQIHEMVWVPPPTSLGPSSASLSELCFINTRFSCLAARSDVFSFIPRWKPPFITELGPDDRCHLNGVGLRDSRPRYATALAECNVASGWRERKRDGGIVIDIAANETIARGLSMPHSPRWYGDQLWVLESGKGGVGIVDARTGGYREVCRLPGFTRGLDFAGPYAVVGLSQVRESAVFGDIAVTEIPPSHRCCGVWFIDARSAQVAGFVNFTQEVQEIFAVQMLHGLRWPDVINEDPDRIALTYELSQDALRQVPVEIRQRGQDYSGD